MSENTPNTDMPASRVYEVIGRMYLQLLSVTEENAKLTNRLAETIQQNNVFSEMLNKNMTSPPQALAQMAAHGVTVKEIVPDEPTDGQ